jgi:hypothetical protein
MAPVNAESSIYGASGAECGTSCANCTRFCKFPGEVSLASQGLMLVREFLEKVFPEPYRFGCGAIYCAAV